MSCSLDWQFLWLPFHVYADSGLLALCSGTVVGKESLEETEGRRAEERR